MIRVTVELIPATDAKNVQHLGTAYIWNDGNGTENVGHYQATLSRRGQPASVWKRGTVRNFPRRRLGAWDLLCRVLAATIGERNNVL